MSTGSSSWRSSRGAKAALALALLFLTALPAPPAAGAESVELELAPAGDEIFPPEGAPPEAAAPAPEPGFCLVVFRYNRLSAASPANMTMLAPDGRVLPLAVEPLFVEFGKIAEARMAFRLPQAEAAAGNGPFTLRWGLDVAGSGSRSERIAADPARRELYRTLRPKPGAAAGDANIAKLEVIADSTAEYHFLWYLLPMSMVFVLLLVRKLLGRGETGSARP